MFCQQLLLCLLQQQKAALNNTNLEILESQKKLFRKTPYKIVFRLKYEELSARQIKDLLLALLDSLELHENQKLKNLRGRPPESFSSASVNLAKNGEEIVNIYGKATLLDSDLAEDFCYSLSTFFSEYTNDGKIVHSLRGKALGALNEFGHIMNISKVCNWMPLSIEGFRFGAESYSRLFLGSMLGAVASIDSRFYIEVNKETAWILLEKIGPKDIFSNFFLSRLDQYLGQSNILKGLLASLKNRYERI